MNSELTTTSVFFKKAQETSAGKQASHQKMRIIAAHKYVSPRARPLTPEESEVRRIAYALKIPTAEARVSMCPM
jgi:hypothetical protein